MSQRLEAFTLFSSSKGNSALFRYGQECVLIDAGVSARALNASLQALGTSLYEIRAISSRTSTATISGAGDDFQGLLHPDLRALPLLPRHSRQMPERGGSAVFAGRSDRAWSVFDAPFPTPHDAEDSVCYRVEAGTAAVGYATDIGHLTAEIGRCILGCDAVVLESNHDIDMLKNGAYPLPLKKRILGAYGHLSNRSCAAALPRLVESGVRRIVLAHPFARKQPPRARVQRKPRRAGRPDRSPSPANRSRPTCRWPSRRPASRCGFCERFCRRAMNFHFAYKGECVMFKLGIQIYSVRDEYAQNPLSCFRR